MFPVLLMFLACTNATNWALTAWHRPILESPKQGFTERSHIFVPKEEGLDVPADLQTFANRGWDRR